MKSEVILGLVAIGAVACSIAQPVHVKPTVEECQAALVQIDDDMGDVIASIHSLELEDKRHIPEWWAAKRKLMEKVASIASSVGRK